MKKKFFKKLIFASGIAFTIQGCQNLLANHKTAFEWSYAAGSLIISPFMQQIFGDYSGIPILKKLAESGLIYCPDSEQDCFVRYLDTSLEKQGYEKIIETFAECNPLREAFNNGLGYLKNNAGSVINDVLKDYFIGSGSCMKAINEYLSFSRSQCPGSIGDQCSKFVTGHDCVSVAKASREVVQAYNKFVGGWNSYIVQPLTQFGDMVKRFVTNTVPSGITQASNTIAQGVVQGAMEVKKAFDNAGRAGEFCPTWKLRNGAEWKNRACSPSEVATWSSSLGVCPAPYVLNYGCGAGCIILGRRCPDY